MGSIFGLSGATRARRPLDGGDCRDAQLLKAWGGPLFRPEGRCLVVRAQRERFSIRSRRSVLAMLLATRDPKVAEVPFSRVLEAVRNAERAAADDEREQALRLFERGVSEMECLFAREGLNEHSLITLTRFDTTARMPLRRVVWSKTFPDVQLRDDFFAWLAERFDRWPDWGKLAFGRGADSLTHHLFGIMAARLSASASK